MNIMKKYLFVALLFFTKHVFAKDVTVTSLAELQTAINKAKPGDVIQLADGVYDASDDIVVTTVGTLSKPITIKAVHVLAAEITGKGGFSLQSPAAYIVIRDFKFTHAASRAKTGVGTSSCQWTNNLFETPGD